MNFDFEKFDKKINKNKSLEALIGNRSPDIKGLINDYDIIDIAERIKNYDVPPEVNRKYLDSVLAGIYASMSEVEFGNKTLKSISGFHFVETGKIDRYEINGFNYYNAKMVGVWDTNQSEHSFTVPGFITEKYYMKSTKFGLKFIGNQNYVLAEKEGLWKFGETLDQARARLGNAYLEKLVNTI